ncbi:GntR family transcriptional regulator [Microbacterium sp. X-17]|uniref:GntR family transcriptional regulator n=1 Tax=Microbacterium sp. X-17 TaxID=3144404 RepID=UPI0031F5BD3A
MSAPPSVERKPALSSVERCLSEIRRMILSGELLPGEKVHQSDLADRLDVSRIPLREALSTLQAEGVLTHRLNSGYQVARFSGGDLGQLYLMRRLLETELLRTATLTPAVAETMESLNEQLKLIDRNEELHRYLQVNEAFHFVPFETSPLRLVRADVARLWYRTGFYRSMYILEANAAERVFAEHGQMIEAARDGDIERLIALSDQHRAGTQMLLTKRLSRPPVH